MLSIHRIATTAAVAAALCVPAAAQARPADVPPAASQKVDLVTPDARSGAPADTPAVPPTRIVEVPQTGFEWGDAAIGGAATLALILLVAGTAITLRPGRFPRRATATSR
jgi:uncharacterized iron-regulated membrane protein